MPVVFDLLHGEAHVGRLRVPIQDAGARGELRVSGAVLRPLAFGERMQVVARAASSRQPVAGVIAGVTAAATVSGAPEGATDTRHVLEVLALALAGADREGPAFAEAVSELGRAVGWRFADILDAPATEVDRLASSLLDASDDGWQRIQFTAAPDDVADGTVEARAIAEEYASNLLRRLDGVEAVPSDEPVTSPAARASGVAAAGAWPSVPAEPEPAPPGPAYASSPGGTPTAPREAAAVESGSSDLSTPAGSPPGVAPRPRWRMGRGAGMPTPAGAALEAAAADALHRPPTRDVSMQTSGVTPAEIALGALGVSSPRAVEAELPAATPSAVTDRTGTAVVARHGRVAVARPHVSESFTRPHVLEETVGVSHSASALSPVELFRRPEPAAEIALPPTGQARARADAPESPDVVADRIAWLLDEECDLRGIER